MRLARRTDIGWALLFALGLTLWGPIEICGQALHSFREVGLVTHVTGDVSLSSASAKEVLPAQEYMKVHDKDTYLLQPDSTLEIVYFVNGKRESWSGPVKFTVTPEMGHLANGAVGAAPKTYELPEALQTHLTQIPDMMQGKGLGSPGGLLVRGIPMELSLARRAYEDSRLTSAPNDVLPELSYLAILDKHKNLVEMQEVVEYALKKKPADTRLLALRDLLASHLGQAPIATQP